MIFFKRAIILAVILTDKFNPVQGSFFECIEHPQCIIEGFTDGNCCPNDSDVYQSCCHQAECLVNPRCVNEGLDTGYCCPDINGNYKECCNEKPTPAPTVMDAACSAHPTCDGLGLTGSCCPTIDGEILGMFFFLICNKRDKTILTFAY